MNYQHAYRKALRILTGTLIVYALLVASHRGEFWPFTIYPMFSQGGQPWSRAVVRDITASPDVLRWEPSSAAALPGQPFPLIRHGISPIDLANFVSKSTKWDSARVTGLKQMFYDQMQQRSLLVMRVNGRLDESDSVRVEFVPYVFLSSERTALHPRLRP